ncbi:hypothetical protein BST12_09025 [Mycobacterium angelicum]|uniref:Uncharacterized protein n=2 Tax=Mycobacterium angelicum TaxID=470074 RepID=A0A1W9ZXZ6_MYCAN|nr:hypothetical protein BST12_09025 [Mycobacterium angelicum]
MAAPAHADPAANLQVTDGVRAELMQAGATLTGRPAAEFTGLAPGRTYYAYMPSETNPTYRAAGAEPCSIPQEVRDLWQWPAGKCYPPA